jgi:hypothetical protein
VKEKADDGKVTQAKNTTPAARPSRPSMRFTALMMPTIQTMVTGSPRGPMLTASLTSGRAMVSIRKPHANARLATAIWAKSL